MTDARARGERQASTPVPAAASPLSRTTYFFLITACIVATIAVVLLRGADAPALVFVVFTIFAAGLTGVALYRTLIPFTGVATDETSMPGGRTRAALERDKMLTLRAIKELEFDREMGKVSEADFDEMRNRLRARALRLLRQLEGEGLYRQVIERDVAERVAALPDATGAAGPPSCASCGTSNDADARFCKACGEPLGNGGAA